MPVYFGNVWHSISLLKLLACSPLMLLQTGNGQTRHL